MSKESHELELPPASTPRTFVGGVLMGAANLVPGVSGGTMILAVGLYDRFIGAVADVTRLRFKPRTMAFLAVFGAGLVLALLALSAAAVWLVTEHRWIAYSLFIGMTLGGVPALWRIVRPLSPGVALSIVAGLALMIGVNQGLSDTALPQTTPVFVGMGALAASSMILPGISGSYILLIFGMYDVVVGSIRPSELFEHPGESLAIVVPVGIGVVIGIGLLSNVLKVLLARRPRPSHGVLLGLLLGSVLGLWPFRDAVHPRLVTREGLGAVERLLAGDELEQIQRDTGVAIPPAEVEALRREFAGASRGDLKRAGLVLQRFEPSATQVALALLMGLGGFLVTLLLAPRRKPSER